MRCCSGTLANIKHERLAFFLPIQGLLQKRHPGTLFFHECRQEQINYRTGTDKGGFFSESAIRFLVLQILKKNIPKN